MQDNNITARVIAQHRGKYRVRNESREYWAEITGKMMFNAVSPSDYPIVGDLVVISELEDGHAIIKEILPRKSLLQRKAVGRDENQPIAANIDIAFIVQSVDRDFNLNRLERYVTIARTGKIEPVIILNKVDLISEQELRDKIGQVKNRFHDIAVLFSSTIGQPGITSIQSAIKKGKVYCFIGSSGVGKSSIINKLLGDELLKTKEISASTNKGRHATTHRELFYLENGGMVIDNPGMREVGIAEAGGVIEDVFSDISDFAANCRFDNCTHIHEPGCAVLAALEEGQVSQEQYANYIKLKKEADHYSMSQLEKKQKDRKFGRMVKNVLKLKQKGK